MLTVMDSKVNAAIRTVWLNRDEHWLTDHGVPRNERNGKSDKFLLDPYTWNSSKSSKQKSNKIKEKKRVSIPQSIPSLKTQNPWGVCIFFSTAYSSQDMEATSVSINSRMDKEGVEDI